MQKAQDLEAKTASDKDQISLGAFEKSMGLLIRVAEISVREDLNTRIRAKDAKLKAGEFTVLQAIGENPGVRQGALARLFHIKWPSMTNLVDAMEKRGLLERVVPQNDRRSVGLVLTDVGQELVDGQIDLMWDVTDEVFSKLSEAEKQTFTRLLRKVAGWPALEV